MKKSRTRAKLEEVEQPNIYFLPKSKIEFVSTGCTLLDCALGGGFAVSRIANIIGDKSTSKTALATETVINFLRQYPDGAAFYREVEAAFDGEYAKSMGLPLDKVEFGDPSKPVITVEEFARDLGAFVGKRLATNTPGIYVLDSLDALSDEAEMERDIGKGSYGTQKAAKMSELFRTCARKIEQTRVLLLIVSQVRENINVAFGEKYRRSGGKALDFFASQFCWLTHMKTLKRTVKKVERAYGILVKAAIKKNKVGPPMRECQLEFHYGFGTEDLLTSLHWLEQVDRLPEKFSTVVYEKLSDSEYQKLTAEAAQEVKKVWADIESNFAPKRSKYT
jgi:recombination protein RecA